MIMFELPCDESIPVNVITILNNRIEMISSATAAPKMVIPDSVFRAFIDFSTATEIETDVAAKMTPIKRLSAFDR
ncbi:hypothetical protein NRIC0776_08110 [Apilactobacillus kunkeei]